MTVDLMAGAPKSLAAYLRQRVAETPKHHAFSEPDRNQDGKWIDYTWAESLEIIDDLAAGLIKLGLKPEERVAINSSTRLEWIFADYAITCAAGATTTIYPNTGPDEVKYILTDSDSVMAIVENKKQLDKILYDKDLDKQLRYIIVIDPAGVHTNERVLSYAMLREIGAGYRRTNPEIVTDRVDAIEREDLSTIIYTSGTTGRPKGVRLPQRVWVFEARAAHARHFLETESEVMYLWLPLSHVFGKCLLAVQLSYNFATYVDGRIDRIVEGLGEVKPTVMCGAPRIFEKVRAAVLTGAGVKAQISRWAFATGRDYYRARMTGAGKVPLALKAKHTIADLLVFSKLRSKLGGKMKLMISGSAQLSHQVHAWFNHAGLRLIEGYGSTELSAIATVDEPHHPSPGSVGLPLPGLEMKLGDDGELLVRGPSVFTGYHKLEDKTKEALSDDGWYATGDIARIDEAGKVWITDRKRDLFKTSGGKYVSPQKVEAAITANIPYVSQAIAVGDGRKYVTALVVMDPALLQRWADKRELGHLSYAELSQRPEIHASVEKQMQKVNERLERWETVKKFAILDHELTVENGGTTANMKIRRSVVAHAYEDIVDGLYPKED